MRNRALLAILIANILGGTSYLVQKLALEGLPPSTITFGRNLVAVVVMWIWARSRGHIQFKSTKREHGLMLVLGTLCFAAPMLLGVIGIRYSTAANGSILILLEPGVILLMSWWLLRERATWIQMVGVVIGLIGALVIVLKDAPIDGLMAEEHLSGNLILILHGVMWGCYTPVSRLLSRTKGVTEITLISMMYAMVLLVPSMLFEIPEWHAGPHLWPAIFWTVVLGVLVSWLGTYLWNFSASQLASRTIAPFVFVQPVAGAGIAWLVLNEMPSAGVWIGTGIIVVGVLLVMRGGPPSPDYS
ncbi:MAG: drug/metabolite transporter (DMT)-like permease [Planctomycetota bacterium]|jgi:drug/metabolite transporter (DMT)-like permease